MSTGGKETTFGQGQTLFVQGDKGGELYFIKSGDVELTVRNDSTGETAVVAKIGEKGILGSMSFMENEERSATAKCLSEVKCIVVNQTHRERLLDQVPQWAKFLMKDLSGSLRSLNNRYTTLENKAQQLEAQVKALKRRVEEAKAAQEAESKSSDEAAERKRAKLFKYLVAVGSNLGDRATLIQRAKISLASQAVEVMASAPLYETAPVGNADRPFLNSAFLCRSDLEAKEFLALILSVEKDLGRLRHLHWGNRTMDLDIILAQDQSGAPISQSTEALTIPHPHALERDFVLVPASEIAPDWVHPVSKKKLAQEVVSRGYALEPIK